MSELAKFCYVGHSSKMFESLISIMSEDGIIDFFYNKLTFPILHYYYFQIICFCKFVLTSRNFTLASNDIINCTVKNILHGWNDCHLHLKHFPCGTFQTISFRLFLFSLRSSPSPFSVSSTPMKLNKNNSVKADIEVLSPNH